MVLASRGQSLSTLQDLGNGLVLVHPLFVRLEQDSPDLWSALSDDLGLVGEGETDSDAVDDLRSQVADLFDALKTMRETLGPQPLRQLEFLERLAGVVR